jgi:hypothetical protein
LVSQQKCVGEIIKQKFKEKNHKLNVELIESNHQKCKAAEQDKRAATRTVTHNRIKVSVNIVEY